MQRSNVTCIDAEVDRAQEVLCHGLDEVLGRWFPAPRGFVAPVTKQVAHRGLDRVAAFEGNRGVKFQEFCKCGSIEARQALGVLVVSREDFEFEQRMRVHGQLHAPRMPWDLPRDFDSRKVDVVALSQLALFGLVAFTGDPVVLAPVRGNVEAGMQEQLQQAVRRSLSLHGDVPITPRAAPRTCVSPRCERELIANHDAKFALSIEATQDETSIEIRLDVRDASGKVVGSVTELCEMCGLEDVVDMVSVETAQVMKELKAVAAPTIRVESVPEGASVYIDGALIGLSPIEVEVEAGDREIELRREGLVSQRRTVKAVGGAREVVHMDMEYQRGKLRLHQSLLIGGVAAVTVGAGVIGGAATMFVIDGRPYKRDCQPDPEGNCKSLYRTKGMAYLTATLGVGAVAAGVIMIVTSRRRKRDENARYSVVPGGLKVRF